MFTENDNASRKLRTQMSYQTALSRYRSVRGLASISWATWIITIATIAMWCFTAYHVALAAGAHSFYDIIANVMNNAVIVQDNDALSNVLITYGANDMDLYIKWQFWRFITPITMY